MASFLSKDSERMLSSDAIIALHDDWTRTWHEAPEKTEGSNPVADGFDPDWVDVICHQHRANFDLWHIEDEARAPGTTDADLASVKRRIDQTNQKRNDLAEQIDVRLLEDLNAQGLPDVTAPLNSESPGLIIDRLSILALKIFHTREEAERADAPPGHTERNLGRLAILEEQRTDLAHCLDILWRETLERKRRFKLYRQLKMYNDPSLNPAIYSKKATG